MILSPKTVRRGYIKLESIPNTSIKINKCDVWIGGSKLYVEDREVNGLLLYDNSAIIIGRHYTSREAANFIRTTRSFSPNEEDNYVYFLEDGFSGTVQEIKQISGARSAEIKFDVKFSVSKDRVWLKIEKGHPVKFAIYNRINSDEIIELTVIRASQF